MVARGSDRQEVHQEVKSTSLIFILGFKQVLVMVASQLSSYRHGYQVKIILKMLQPPTGCNKNISETSETRRSAHSVCTYTICVLIFCLPPYNLLSICTGAFTAVIYYCDILQWYITVIYYNGILL